MERDSGREKAQGRAARNTVLASANADTVGRYGSGVKEHLAGYIGEDRQTGQVLSKGLKAISEETISPKQPYLSVGGVNHPLYDLISVGEGGSYIEGSARQLKYVGKDAKECCDRLLQKKFDKYRDADDAIEVPKDFYDGVQAELDGHIGKLKDQIAKAEANGSTEQLEKLRERLIRAEQTKEALKQGRLTTDEAIEARLHPKLSTAKDVGRLAHQGGLEAARMGAAIGGGMSFIRNAVALCKAIRLRANLFERLLIKLDALLAPLTGELENIIRTSGTDFSRYTQAEKAVVAANLSVVKAVKAVLDTPILTQDGRLTEESQAIAGPVRQVIRSGGRG